MQKIQQHLLIHFIIFYNPTVVIPLYHMRSTSYFSGCFWYGSVLLSNHLSLFQHLFILTLSSTCSFSSNFTLLCYSVWSGFMCHTTQGGKWTLSQLFYWHRCTIIELWNFLQQYPQWFSQRT